MLSIVLGSTVTLSAHQFVVMLVIGIVGLALALLLLFKPRYPAAVPAYASLLALHASTYIYLTTSALVFWGCATLLVALLHMLLPKGEPAASRASNLYVGLGALAGLAVGIAVSARIVILGVILGTFLGLFAYSRTPKGSWLKFPTFTFIQYFCAKGLPAIVAVAIIGIVIEGFLVR